MSNKLPYPFAGKALAVSPDGIAQLEAMERFISAHPAEVAEAKRAFAQRQLEQTTDEWKAIASTRAVTPSAAIPRQEDPAMSPRKTRQPEDPGIAEARRMGELHAKQARAEQNDAIAGVSKLLGADAEKVRAHKRSLEAQGLARRAPTAGEQAKADAERERLAGLPAGSIAKHREELRRRLFEGK